jgi:hypothetical protein
MAGLKGKSGPPGNMNAFKHGLAAIQRRREESITTEHEESIKQQILKGLIADKGGDDQISTATRITLLKLRVASFAETTDLALQQVTDLRLSSRRTCNPARASMLISLSRLAPVDTKLAQPPPILYGGRIGAAKVQLFAQVERQLLRPLRFDDAPILFEGEPMPVLHRRRKGARQSSGP